MTAETFCSLYSTDPSDLSIFARRSPGRPPCYTTDRRARGEASRSTCRLSGPPRGCPTLLQPSFPSVVVGSSSQGACSDIQSDQLSSLGSRHSRPWDRPRRTAHTSAFSARGGSRSGPDGATSCSSGGRLWTAGPVRRVQDIRAIPCSLEREGPRGLRASPPDDTLAVVAGLLAVCEFRPQKSARHAREEGVRLRLECARLRCHSMDCRWLGPNDTVGPIAHWTATRRGHPHEAAAADACTESANGDEDAPVLVWLVRSGSSQSAARSAGLGSGSTVTPPATWRTASLESGVVSRVAIGDRRRCSPAESDIQQTLTVPS